MKIIYIHDRINTFYHLHVKKKKGVYGPAGFRVALNSRQILEAQAKERSVSGESHIAERAHAIQLLKQALPVCLDGNGAWSILAIQVSVQDVYGLLVHC